MAPSKVPLLPLNNGRHIPQFGLGTWLSKPGEVTQAVKDAIDAGYRHIDCAFCYGNENEVGTAIKDKIKDGTVKREELFITSKLWNTFHSEGRVLPALQKSLEALGLGYVDLYLIHWPMGYKEGGEIFPKDEEGKFLFSDVDFMETWRVMETAVEKGYSKAIGMSNFNSKQVERIWSVAKVKPSVLQVECHPYLNQKKLLEFCKNKGLVFTAYSPLGSPARPWAKPEDPKLTEDPKLLEIGKKFNKTPAHVLIRYQIQRGAAVIPKSVTKSRIEANIDVFDFTLSDEDMKYIDSFDCNGRLLHLTWVNHHPHYPFHEEY